jgi:hypothetical protein
VLRPADKVQSDHASIAPAPSTGLEFTLFEISGSARPKFSAVTTFGYQGSGITAFALVTLLSRRELIMPVRRYIAWVGTTLLALLYLADWFLPKSLPDPTPDAVVMPVIRIASVQQPPERIIIDTSQPTITPPPMVEETIASRPLPLQSYASVPLPSAIADVDHKKRKSGKRRTPKLAPDRPQFASIPAPTSHGSATNVPPVRLSFIDLVSRLRRNLFHSN